MIYHAANTSFVRDAAKGAMMGVYWGPSDQPQERIYIHFHTRESAFTLKAQIEAYLSAFSEPLGAT